MVYKGVETPKKAPMSEEEKAVIGELVDEKLAPVLQELEELKEKYAALQAGGGVASAPATRSTVLVVSVEKPEGGSKVGISLSELEETGALVVKSVKPDGLMGSTGLEAGMELFSINGAEVAGKSASEAAGMLLEAEGTVTVIAVSDSSCIKAGTIVKESADTKVGLALADSDSGTIIHNIKEDSLAAETPLEKGMLIRSVNSTSCGGKGSSEIQEMIAESEGNIVIVAEDIVASS